MTAAAAAAEAGVSGATPAQHRRVPISSAPTGLLRGEVLRGKGRRRREEQSPEDDERSAMLQAMITDREVQRAEEKARHKKLHAQQKKMHKKQMKQQRKAAKAQRLNAYMASLSGAAHTNAVTAAMLASSAMGAASEAAARGGGTVQDHMQSIMGTAMQYAQPVPLPSKDLFVESSSSSSSSSSSDSDN